MIGVNITDIDNLKPALLTLSELAKLGKLTARLVVDNGRPVSDYKEPALQISQYADLMVQVQDSYGDAKVSTSALFDKADKLYKMLNPITQIWEIANEINGDWLSTSAFARATFLSSYFGTRNCKRAVTLFVQPDYLAWAASNKIPCEYVFLSSYPTNKKDLLYNWENDFKVLQALYPNALLGFGEFGYENWRRPDLAAKKSLIAYYYGMQLKNKKYVGGCFWWDFQETCCPPSTQLYDAIQAAIKGNPQLVA